MSCCSCLGKQMKRPPANFFERYRSSKLQSDRIFRFWIWQRNSQPETFLSGTIPVSLISRPRWRYRQLLSSVRPIPDLAPAGRKCHLGCEQDGLMDYYMVEQVWGALEEVLGRLKGP